MKRATLKAKNGKELTVWVGQEDDEVRGSYGVRKVYENEIILSDDRFCGKVENGKAVFRGLDAQRILAEFGETRQVNGGLAIDIEISDFTWRN